MPRTIAPGLQTIDAVPLNLPGTAWHLTGCISNLPFTGVDCKQWLHRDLPMRTSSRHKRVLVDAFHKSLFVRACSPHLQPAIDRAWAIAISSWNASWILKTNSTESFAHGYLRLVTKGLSLCTPRVEWPGGASTRLIAAHHKGTELRDSHRQTVEWGTTTSRRSVSNPPALPDARGHASASEGAKSMALTARPGSQGHAAARRLGQLACINQDRCHCCSFNQSDFLRDEFLQTYGTPLAACRMPHARSWATTLDEASTPARLGRLATTISIVRRAPCARCRGTPSEPGTGQA